MLNPALVIKTSAPVVPVAIRPTAPASIPAKAVANDPYDMFDERGNSKKAEPVKAPEPVKQAPAKPEPQASFFDHWFGKKEEKQEIAAVAVPERKSFRGNTEVNVAERPAKIIPSAPAKVPAPAPIIASKPAELEPVIASTQSAPEPEPQIVSIPTAPKAVEAEETPVAITSETEVRPIAADIDLLREDMGNGVIIPQATRKANAIKTPKPIKPRYTDDMAKAEPTIAPAPEKPEASAQQVVQLQPAAEPAPAPKLADVPEKPAIFQEIKKTKDADQKDLLKTHDKAMDAKEELAKEPTDLPKIEDTIEEIRGALESPTPIITASVH